jgi:hypothetical protein
MSVLVPMDGVLGSVAKVADRDPAAAAMLVQLGMFEALTEQIEAVRTPMTKAVLRNMDQVAKSARRQLERTVVAKGEAPDGYAQALDVIDDFVAKGLLGTLIGGTLAAFNREHPRDQKGRFVTYRAGQTGLPKAASMGEQQSHQTTELAIHRDRMKQAKLIDDDTLVHVGTRRRFTDPRTGVQEAEDTVRYIPMKAKDIERWSEKNKDNELPTELQIRRSNLKDVPPSQLAAIDLAQLATGGDFMAARKLTRGVFDDEGNPKKFGDAEAKELARGHRGHQPADLPAGQDARAGPVRRHSGRPPAQHRRQPRPADGRHRPGGREGAGPRDPPDRLPLPRHRASPGEGPLRGGRARHQVDERLQRRGDGGRRVRPDPQRGRGASNLARRPPTTRRRAMPGTTRRRSRGPTRPSPDRRRARPGCPGRRRCRVAARLRPRELTELSLASGEVPPSEGVIIDADGDTWSPRRSATTGTTTCPSTCATSAGCTAGSTCAPAPLAGRPPRTSTPAWSPAPGRSRWSPTPGSSPSSSTRTCAAGAASTTRSPDGRAVRLDAGRDPRPAERALRERPAARDDAGAAHRGLGGGPQQGRLREAARRQDPRSPLACRGGDDQLGGDRAVGPQAGRGPGPRDPRPAHLPGPEGVADRGGQERPSSTTETPSVRKLKLDGSGYFRAMRALQQEFPYYIRKVDFRRCPSGSRSAA